MSKAIGIVLTIAVAIVVSAGMFTPGYFAAASDVKIDRDIDVALANLYATAPQAKALADKARGVLVLPRVYTRPGSSSLVTTERGRFGSLARQLAATTQPLCPMVFRQAHSIMATHYFS